MIKTFRIQDVLVLPSHFFIYLANAKTGVDLSYQVPYCLYNLLQKLAVENYDNASSFRENKA